MGARDVYIDITVQTGAPDLLVIPTISLPAYPPSTFEASFGLRSTYYALGPEEVFGLATDRWSSSMEVSALQPQRQVSPPAALLIGAMGNCDVAIRARIYADTLAEPVDQKLEIRLNVGQSSVTADEALRGLVEEGGTD